MFPLQLTNLHASLYRSHLLIYDVLLSVLHDAVCYVLYYNYVAWCLINRFQHRE